MSEERNYTIDNCITDLDTLICLDKRAIKDLENNTHEIEQQEVLTIIREFIRLRNDYNKEKEKNKELSEKVTQNICNRVEAEVLEEYRLKVQNSISKDKIKELIDKINIDGYSCQECIGEIIELLEESH